MKEKNIQSAFYTYALTALIGLSFLSILFVFTWIDTKNTYENEFQFTANNISDVIASRIQAANDTLNNLVAFLDGNPRISNQQFQSLISSITSSHEFMRGAVLVSRDMDQGGNTSNYTVNNIYLKDENSSQITVQDIINNLVDAQIDNNSVNALSSGIFSNDWQSFWL
ncbi:MAG: hypothetical protein HKN08_04055, partial [Gammaproteobacteria bacterium]|nr:hypothetical protein [Gammaproteobacteria bacterium]